jgi:hypothetical protein
MRKISSFLSVIGLTFCLAVIGCSSNKSGSNPGSNGNGSGNSGTPAISVSITSPASAPTIQQGQTVNITAAVANDSANKGVTWSLSGQGTLSGQTSTAVTYNAPATVTSNTTVTVTATSVADSTKMASTTVTVTPASQSISVSIANKFTTIAAGGAATTLNATVQNDSSNSGVTWTLTAGGSACSPTCGALSGNTSTSVTYTPPTIVPAAPNNAPTITATSVADATKTDADSFTVTTGGQLSLLNGQYAFEVSGWTAGMAGEFTADGNGNVTGGVFDLENVNQYLVLNDTAISSGTYTVTNDNRGTMTFKDSGGNTYSFDFALGTVSSGVATKGAMIETDSNWAFLNTGSLELQQSTAFSTTSFSGGYVIGMSGWDANQNVQVTVGSTSISAGSLSNGIVDTNDGGSLASDLSFTGTLSVANTGRGTVTTSVDATDSTTAVYVISATKAYVISTATSASNNEHVVVGSLQQQSGGPYSVSSINGSMIFVDQGGDGVPAPYEMVGILTSSGNGSLSLTADVNDGGTVSLNQTFTATDAFTSASNGRFTLTPQSGTPIVGYMIAPNEAMLVGTGGTPDFCSLIPQSAGPFTAVSLNGTYVLQTLPFVSPPNGSGGMSVQPETVESGVVTLEAGSATSTIDMNQAQNGTSTSTGTGTYTVGSNGRVTTNGNTVLYIVSPTKVIALSLDTGGNPFVQVGEQ